MRQFGRVGFVALPVRCIPRINKAALKRSPALNVKFRLFVMFIVFILIIVRHWHGHTMKYPHSVAVIADFCMVYFRAAGYPRACCALSVRFQSPVLVLGSRVILS